MSRTARLCSLAALCAVLLRGCAPPGDDEVVFNEMLASVLRGVLIKGPIADQLGVRPGYYRIRECRVWGEPDKRAIVLCILKPYGVLVDPTLTVLPLASEEFVCSHFSERAWDSVGYRATARDQHGHVFRSRVTWGSPHFIAEATIDGTSVRVSTHTYGGGQLNTAGWEPETEEVFTVPDT